MLTDEQINAIGFALEDEGFSHSDIDEYLEHHGVKGMKWGTRRSGPGSKTAMRVTRKIVGNQNAAARQKKNAARDKMILDARANAPKVKSQLKDAKTQLKLDKVAHGKAEAKRIYNDKKWPLVDQLQTSRMLTSGKEKTAAILGTAAIAGMYVASINIR